MNSRPALKLLMNLLLLAGDAGPSMLSLMHEETLLSVGEITYHDADVVHYPYSPGILALGVDSFLSATVEFCHDVAREGKLPIVSVGSGDGSIEKKISEAYRKRYGKNLDIILVDPDPRYRVHYEYVDELIEKRPSIVGHCAMFIFWPEPAELDEGAYDLEAVRSLLPHGLLSVYERFGGSGSEGFVQFLSDDFVLPWSKMGVRNHLNQFLSIATREECDSYGLDNYEVDELAQRELYKGEIIGTGVYRMVVARRVDFHFVDVCPVINWTCRKKHLEFEKFVADNIHMG